jgi:uncharacterized membrane protein YfcA
MHLSLWITVVVSGAAGQFLDSIAGMGFGALSSTIMVSGGLSPVVVIGVVNVAKVGGGLASGLSHWRLGNVRWPWVLPMLIPAVAGGVMASLALTRMPEQAIRLIVPALLLAMGVLILYRFIWPRPMTAQASGGEDPDYAVTAKGPILAMLNRCDKQAPLTVAWLSPIGFAGGVLNGLSGAFGPFTTTAMVLRQTEHPRFAVGTVNFVEFFVAGAVSLTLISSTPPGQWHWGLPVALMAGSLASAPFGAYLSRHLPAKALGALMGIVLITLNAWSLARIVV